MEPVQIVKRIHQARGKVSRHGSFRSEAHHADARSRPRALHTAPKLTHSPFGGLGSNEYSSITPLSPRASFVTGGLIALFLARINLKDFRDRDGDALYGKPTLLLRFGKQTTCLVSLVALLVGNLLLLAALQPSWFIALSMQCFVAAIGYMLFTMWRVDESRSEQIAIEPELAWATGF
jgi:4-hydroxybenzoate polyprenyltransferase